MEDIYKETTIPEVPIWKKSNLTVNEAATKLRELSDKEDCPFVLWVGSKRLIKRRQLDEFLSHMYSI